jgi:hypothetical protein
MSIFFGQEVACWFITMKRTCQAQLLAETALIIDEPLALATQN